MKESTFQSKLISEVRERFPGSIVMKLDAKYKRGIPDILVLYEDRWATLECKREEGAHKQQNQDYYVNKMNDMSFSRFVNPENKEEVLNDLERSFKTRRSTRNTKPK